MRKLNFALMTVLVLMLVNCNGAVIIRAPALTAVITDVDGFTVYWERDSEIESSSDFAGYNVYVYTDSTALLVDDGEELNKFNGRVIADTVFHVSGLSQDSIYYVQVRTVNIENKVGSYNDETPFLKASPRPEHTVTLYLQSGTGGPTDSCAVRFSDALIVADSLMADSAADMWVRTSADTVWVESPTLHSLYGSGTHQSLFINIGLGDFYSITSVAIEPSMERSEVAEGELIIGKTEDGNYVKIYVEAVDISNGTITFLYAYQNIVAFPYF